MDQTALIVSAASGLVTILFIIPVILAIRSANRIAESIRAENRLADVMLLTRIYVFAAEQIYGKGKGAEKLEYVKKALAQEGVETDGREQLRMRAMIEAAVRELKYLEQD